MKNGTSKNGSDATGAGSAKPAGRAASKPLPQWAIQSIGNVCWVISRILWRIEYQGLDHIPTEDRGFVVVANHQTYVDPVWLGIPMRKKTRYLAWDAAFNWPVVGRALSLVGAWPLQIERGNPTAVRRSVQWLRDGGALVIFPEGGRCFDDGEMVRFKQGAFRMAIEANVPILPVTIRGGERVWPRGWRFPHFGKVEVVFHPPREIVCAEGEEVRDCARRLSEDFFEIISAGRG